MNSSVDYIDILKGQLLEQFKEKKNIESLIVAIGKQFNDLYMFFLQLYTERDIYKAEGLQLDGIGDIVCLTRVEAGILDGSSSPKSLDDETYRKYLLYKIFRNTCNCTYYDVMKAASMFWSGPNLRYSESIDNPAMMQFDFEESSDIWEQSFTFPFAKAGGVGIKMRMHRKEETEIGIGFALERLVSESFGCEVPDLDINTYLTDEDDNILINHNGAWLCL